MKNRRQLHPSIFLFGFIKYKKPAYLHTKLVWTSDSSKYPNRGISPSLRIPIDRTQQRLRRVLNIALLSVGIFFHHQLGMLRVE